MTKRVVITSIGAITSLGFRPEKILESIKKQRVSFEKSSFDNDLSICPVKNFDVKQFTGRFKNLRYLNRGASFSVASAMEAVKNSKLNKEDIQKAGLFVGSGPNLDLGGECPEIQKGEVDWKKLKALWILKFLPNTAASAIATLAGIHGENLTITTACSASLQAIGEAFRKIKHGYLNLAFAGGGDSRLSKGGLMAYKKANVLLINANNPGKEYAPYDESRKGFIPGEGGAFFLLEELEHAKKRGAKIYCEICGFGSSIDGYNMTAPHPKGKWGEKAVLEALKEAYLNPNQIDVISSHGTGTVINDEMEASLINRIYKKHKPLIIALKSWIGHISAACGALEFGICLICMENNYLPEIRNLKNPCHSEINFVKKSKSHSYKRVMLQNFGFGGQNSALIIKAWKE
ncbi:Beta-ketoacyl-(acyl-carrier-protein) synthase family protein [Candidatus Magnetomoraceae bacterium gMMP-15]